MRVLTTMDRATADPLRARIGNVGVHFMDGHCFHMEARNRVTGEISEKVGRLPSYCSCHEFSCKRRVYVYFACFENKIARTTIHLLLNPLEYANFY